VSCRALAAALCLALGSAVAAQDAPPSDWRARSVVGSVAVAFDATLERLAGENTPAQTFLLATASYAPFVNEHWQLGFAPGIYTNWSSFGRLYSGTAGFIANYFPGDPKVSSPFIGAYLSANAASNISGYTVFGAHTGWLRFLSPELAVRSELRFRHYQTARPANQADVFVTFDSYLFGRARPIPTRLPDFGTVDVNVLADFVFDPGHTLTMNLTAAPFLTRWLETGGLASFLFLFDENVSQRSIEGFARGYVPVSSRALPFADLYLGRENVQFGTSTRGTHGGRVGVRSYLAPGLALDVYWEWRNFTDLEPEQRQLRARLTSQIRVARSS